MPDFIGKKAVVKNGSWTVFLGLCKGCGICVEKCPYQAMSLLGENSSFSTPSPEIEPEKCTLCGICDLFCPDCAIRIDKQNL